MKFSINQTEFQTALTIVLKGVASRSTLPILSGVFFKAYGDTLTLQTTDLKLSVQYQVAALIEIEGETVVPAKLLSEIVKNLPDAAVHLETSDDSVSLLCEAASFSLKTLQAQDFPAFPEVKVQQKIAIPFPQFCSMIKRVARVVSRDESRAVLTGILITNDSGHLKMVATDSYRLAITEADIPEIEAEEFEAVISGAFLQDITALKKTEETIQLALSENQIVITYQDTVFINRRIEGNYPNYKQLLPAHFATRIEFNTHQLTDAVRRTSLLSNTTSPVRLDINHASQTAQLSTVTQDVGAAQELISCGVEGEDVEIAFNFAYVLDGLNAVGTEKVYLETQSSLKPGILKSDTTENFLYLIMPVRIS
ncbi:MAG: DNA polymerase III subunit beta [Raoultibacter sp.]